MERRRVAARIAGAAVTVSARFRIVTAGMRVRSSGRNGARYGTVVNVAVEAIDEPDMRTRRRNAGKQGRDQCEPSGEASEAATTGHAADSNVWSRSYRLLDPGQEKAKRTSGLVANASSCA